MWFEGQEAHPCKEKGSRERGAEALKEEGRESEGGGREKGEGGRLLRLCWLPSPVHSSSPILLVSCDFPENLKNLHEVTWSSFLLI